MKNFVFAPNVVRTSYRSSFFGNNYGSEFFEVNPSNRAKE